jgi:predicted thioesterase
MGDALRIGLEGEASRRVEHADTAVALGSGDVQVFGTPALVALMEAAAIDALEGALPDGTTSVGTRIEVDHLAPSKVGAKVRATARLTETGKRALLFECEAHDGDTLIGRGLHRRVLVDRAGFGA